MFPIIAPLYFANHIRANAEFGGYRALGSRVRTDQRYLVGGQFDSSNALSVRVTKGFLAFNNIRLMRSFSQMIRIDAKSLMACVADLHPVSDRPAKFHLENYAMDEPVSAVNPKLSIAPASWGSSPDSATRTICRRSRMVLDLLLDRPAARLPSVHGRGLRGARRRVNGTDKAQEIAALYRLFLDALLAAEVKLAA